MKSPKFSSGWLKSFKHRHQIKRYTRHEEAGAVDKVEVEDELIELRKELIFYESDDIYNMDKSALF